MSCLVVVGLCACEREPPKPPAPVVLPIPEKPIELPAVEGHPPRTPTAEELEEASRPFVFNVNLLERFMAYQKKVLDALADPVQPPKPRPGAKGPPPGRRFRATTLAERARLDELGRKGEKLSLLEVARVRELVGQILSQYGIAKAYDLKTVDDRLQRAERFFPQDRASEYQQMVKDVRADYERVTRLQGERAAYGDAVVDAIIRNEETLRTQTEEMARAMGAPVLSEASPSPKP